ncbi:MAG: ATP dependent RNA helicase [Gammaproteobacteria bacterium]|nr:ATP dependent RNA helicase [Gammaproteobacteria bacterium]
MNRRTATVAQTATTTPDLIRNRVALLIRHYLSTRSPAIAASVVRHIEQLCDHPEFDGDSEERCMYLRLRRHWRWLSIAPTELRSHV